MYNLWIFLFVGSDAADPQQVLAALQPPEAVVELGKVHAIRIFCSWSLLLPAALAAERLGRDDLAEYFALQGEDLHLQWHIVAACRAVRARILQRQGDRAGAVKLWQLGASEVMENRLPFCAIRLGQDCGGEEGARIFEEALTMMPEADRTELEGLVGNLSYVADLSSATAAATKTTTPSHATDEG